ncbi:MAG: DUF6455 family protein [Gammaproteobacteria bacterium]|nr:DUF6455 family protein [Gammaproteobacteria bacterium]
MNMTLTQFLAAIVMAGVAIGLFFAYRKYLAANSERRMLAMLESVGLDPAIASSGDIQTIMGEVRQRCQSCASEDVCERWLRHDEEGDNDFCPNARAFEILKKYSKTAT